MFRITVVENVYCQSPSDEPFHLNCVYEVDAASVEDPYQKPYRLIPHAPIVIDLGWLGENAGMVHIRNRGNSPVKLMFDDVNGLEIPKRNSIRFYPLNYHMELISIEDTKVIVTIFPK